jgi:aspartate racemase
VVKDMYKAIIQDLIEQGAEGIILGCKEIGLLVKPEDSAVPLFDTTLIHAKGAVSFALDIFTEE